METKIEMYGQRSRLRGRKAWMLVCSMLIVLALLLQIGQPFVEVVQAAGPGGPTGFVTYNTAAQFTGCTTTMTGTTVTNTNPDGEVRLLATLEDYFSVDGAVNPAVWNSGRIYDWYLLDPVVAGGLLTLDGNYVQSVTQFNQSGRFMEARALVRSNANNASNTDIGFYRNMPPYPPSPEGAPITADTAVRIFLTQDSGSNNLLTRLADGTETYYDDDEFTDPDLTQWHVYRIVWGATDTEYYIDGVLQSTMTEQLAGGDSLIARVLFYHMDESYTYGNAPMQVDWVRAGQYPTTGTFISCAYDAGGVVNFSNLSWAASVPSGSTLTIQASTSLDGTTWSSWSSPINAASGTSSGLNIASGRYFRYQLNFGSTSRTSTAELQSITANYYGPTTLDVTPASVTMNAGTTQQFTATARDANNTVVSGVTINWTSTVGSIDANGLFTAPATAGTYNNAVTGTLNRTTGGSLSDSSNVTVVVPNLPPLADAGGPYNGFEGSPIALIGTGSDPEGGPVTFAWNLDANPDFETPGQNVNGTWTDNGSFTIQLRVTDNVPQSTIDPATVTVANVPPTATFNAPSAAVNEGTPFQISLTSPVDPSTADVAAGFNYRFDCGSGTFGSYSSSSTANCTPNDNGTLTVRGQIRDKDMGESPIYTATVTVNNVAPSATFNAPTSVNEGSNIALSFTAPVDPSSVDLASLQYAFDCGSGSLGSFGASSTANCPTTDNGLVTVRGQVRDKDGGLSPIYSAIVTVNNVAPTATFNAPNSVNEGENIAISLTSPVDPSSADVAAGFEYAFDCGSGALGSFSTTSTAACPTTDDGSVTVRGQIRDKDGGLSPIYSKLVTVNNVAPQITSVTNSGPVGVNANVNITVLVTAYAGDTLAYEFDCDDNGVYEVGPQASNVGVCSFASEGTFTVRARVSDEDGSSDSDTTQVMVRTLYLYLPMILKAP